MLVSNLLFTMELYETMRAFQGRWVLMPWHQRRVNQSCEHFGLAPFDLNHAIDKNFVNSGEAFLLPDLRIRLTYGGETCEVLHELLPEWDACLVSSQAWKVKKITYQRHNPHFKLNNRQELDAQANSALQEGYNEVLLCDEQGYFGEGSRTNILAVKRADKESGALFEISTPVKGVLPGVLRAYLMEKFPQQILWKDHQFHLDDLEKFPLFFASNSIRGLHPFEGYDEAIFQDFADLVNPVFYADWQKAPSFL